MKICSFLKNFKQFSKSATLLLTATLLLQVIQDVLEHGLVYSGGVIKDERDTKHYATLVLPNNLRVLVISQPGTQVQA